MDRISSLPDDVIIHILSFLTLKRSAQTSVLSKRWRILFAFSPNLDLLPYGNHRSFLNFVEERVLSVSGNSSVKKFTLRYRTGTRTKHCIRHVLNRGGLSDLHLSLYTGDDGADLPCEIFTCKTLVELKLTDFFIKELPEDASLPALKKLLLGSVKFDSPHPQVCAFAKLLSACPVLEELVLDDLRWEQWKWSRSLSSRSLRRLTIRRTNFDADMSGLGNITIDTPSVTHLEYADFVPSSYLVVNLNSLVEATLNTVLTVDHLYEYLPSSTDNITSDPTNLFKGMRNVQIMNLLFYETVEVFYRFRGAVPVFENLLHLSIKTNSDDCWRGLIILLNHCPNLHTLTIKGTLHYEAYNRSDCVCDCLSEYSFLMSCPVKVLKITEYGGTPNEFLQLINILEKLSGLELLEVTTVGTAYEKFQIAKELQMLPKALSKDQGQLAHHPVCQIQN
ncbi:hypothetical protein Bca4012_086157 [Brassica carinata]|uniref:FBD domain-containing protein n=1 Tax=Brassica carinata TaxID=52824 RepID=A0A8X7UC62_BRACI|nr:hypothetical protein Bca52824_067812 [Brassica carinata]